VVGKRQRNKKQERREEREKQGREEEVSGAAHKVILFLFR
jgi:hypothetical protein